MANPDNINARRLIIASKQAQKFTLKERDNETGLDYSINRYYSSIQGRFTSADPTLSSIDVTNPQTLNRYTYALNNPLVYVDPDGLEPTIGSYNELNPEQRRLFETYVDSNYADQIGDMTTADFAAQVWNESALIANVEGGDVTVLGTALTQSQLTTFIGVTSMWASTGVSESIVSVTEIRGAVKDDNFSLRGEFREAGGEYIRDNWKDIPGETHAPYTTSRRERGYYEEPNGQFKLPDDLRSFQSDVDYNKLLLNKGFIKTLIPNPDHNKSSNSDIRHGKHLERHTGTKGYGPVPITRAPR